MRSKHAFRASSLFLLGLSICLITVSGIANAERTAATPQVGGTVTLFGETYSVNGIDFKNTAWPGTGVLNGTGPGGYDFTCGLGLGFVEGANEAADRLLLTDECDTGGELGIILTGVAASPVYAPTVTVSSTVRIVDNNPPRADPSGIEWISDVAAGGSKTDINYRVVLGVNFSLAAFDMFDFPLTVWSSDTPPGPWEVDSDAGMPYKGLASCKNNTGAGATRMFVGGVDTTGSGHFAYLAFDLTTDSFVNQNSVWLDGIGTPDDGVQPTRALRGLAFDGTYYYAMVKKPGVAESWLYRYDAFPDPGVASAAHPEGSPLSDQLDTATGICWPSTNNRPDRAGIACGRIHNNGKPVFYILAEHFLYTLVPQSPPLTPTATPPPSADVNHWDSQR